jgi:glycosyltransferase involved in cell wall biosynthesis
MKRPAVTLIGTLPPIKGISSYCQELLQALSKCAEIEFIGFRKLYPDFIYPGGTKVADNNWKTPELRNVKVRNILTYYNPFSWVWAGLTAKGRVIHAQWWSYVLAPIYFVILLICKVRRKKILLTVHNILPHERSRLNKFLNRIVLSLGDEFIVHNVRNRENLLNLCDIQEDRISVIPHGILVPVPIKEIPKEEARAQFGIPQNKKVILHFGNIRDYKGLDILLRALTLIIDEVSDVILLIAGKPWTDWSKKYEKIIKDSKLEHYVVKRLDFILPTEVEHYFSVADIVALPYKYFDSQSGVGALALPFKKPLVVTNVGGLPDFVDDERAIARPSDANDLAKRLVVILKDEHLLRKLSEDSKKLSNKLSWDKIAERTSELYKEVLKSSH